jgi:hypothetical protein
MSRAQVLWSRRGSVVRFAAVVLGLLVAFHPYMTPWGA